MDQIESLEKKKKKRRTSKLALKEKSLNSLRDNSNDFERVILFT